MGRVLQASTKIEIKEEIEEIEINDVELPANDVFSSLVQAATRISFT